MKRVPREGVRRADMNIDPTMQSCIFFPAGGIPLLGTQCLDRIHPCSPHCRSSLLRVPAIGNVTPGASVGTNGGNPHSNSRPN
jgi:hypothetical protein